MKLISNKSITQKIIISIILVIVINFTLGFNYSRAGLSDNIGNMLLDTLVSIGDGVLMVANGVLYNQWKSFIPLDIGGGAWKWLAGIGTGIAITARSYSFTVYTSCRPILNSWTYCNSSCRNSWWFICWKTCRKRVPG